jgi:hypothetical protein
MANGLVPAPQATCWACGLAAPETVFLVDQHGIPPGEDGHNILYGHIRIGLCPRCDNLQIERLDHDCFDYESVWDQYEWYLLEGEMVPLLRSLLRTCPLPLDRSCRCAIHQQMRTACGSLPISGWSFGLEAPRHVHHLRVGVSEGRLQMEPAVVSPANRLPEP